MEYRDKKAPSYHKWIKRLIKDGKQEALHELLMDLDEVEIANSLMQLKLKYQVDVIKALDREKTADVMSQLQDHEPIIESIIEKLNTEELGDIVEEMDKDDAADMMALIDDEMVQEILDELPAEDREELQTLLHFDEESAGGIMDPDVVHVLKDQNAGDATKRIKEYIKAKEIDEFYVIYVVDEHEHLIGRINLSQLFLADDQEEIRNIMDPDVIAVSTDMDQEKVASLAKEYDLVTIPVIDDHLRLVGRITIDDIIDVMQEEFEEDLAHVAGTGDEDVLDTSLIKASKQRLPWLLLGLVGGAMAAFVMRGYESSLARLPQVAYFIPVIAALGGNIAIQSSSLVVRGLATGELHTKQLMFRAWKEIRIGMINGIICAILLLFIAWWITDKWLMGLTTAGALLVVVFLAAFVGTVVPMLLKRMDMDPALATGPFITTTNDILGIVIYLAITISVYNTQM
jgi:magnesium transporter